MNAARRPAEVERREAHHETGIGDVDKGEQPAHHRRAQPHQQARRRVARLVMRARPQPARQHLADHQKDEGRRRQRDGIEQIHVSAALRRCSQQIGGGRIGEGQRHAPRGEIVKLERQRQPVARQPLKRALFQRARQHAVALPPHQPGDAMGTIHDQRRDAVFAQHAVARREAGNVLDEARLSRRQREDRFAPPPRQHEVEPDDQPDPGQRSQEV